MDMTEKNWNECLESLGFIEQKNSFGGMVVYNNNNIPCWTYTTK